VISLNARALRLVEALLAIGEERRVAATPIEGGGRFIDCGIAARGGLAAGIDLARICLAGLADVAIVPGDVGGRPFPSVQVVTDHPVLSCLGSQYAGWAVSEGKYFAMGSGPMRAASRREPLFAELGIGETPDAVVGVLEGRKPPTAAVVAGIAEACGVAPDAVTLLGAPTASLAGGAQVVARSVETALHKLHGLDFDLSRVVSAHGVAPLPPVAEDDMAAIGRTNDAILYGARVVLFVSGDDASLESVGPKVPAVASHDYGDPFATIFARYNHDFYAVDPHLFSPAEVVFHNIDTGKVHSFGQLAPEILVRSFLGD
jgi:methenyltetrahydromethanopterin cyclohydrolase